MDVREQKPRMLVVCEGEKTEPLYFRAFPLTTLRVKVVGTGANTLSVVEAAIAERDRTPRDDPFDRVWAVFDRDSFPKQRFDQALSLARREGISVAWSNEAFELWYLLHFEYNDAARSRDAYADRLTHYLGRPYDKAHPDLYDRLLPLQSAALRNAERLADHWKELSPDPAKRNPATTVDQLVLELNRHRRR